MSEENKSKGTLFPLLPAAGINLANGLYGSLALDAIASEGRSEASYKVLDDAAKRVKGGVKIVEDLLPVDAAFHSDHVGMPLFERILTRGKGFASFNDARETVEKALDGKAWGISDVSKSDSVLAHEMGHALGGKTLTRLNALGKKGILPSVLGAAFLKDDDNAKHAAMLGTGLMLPTLASEADASRRAFGLLREMGHGRIRSAKPFAMLATYLATASLPGATYAYRKMHGDFDKD